MWHVGWFVAPQPLVVCGLFSAVHLTMANKSCFFAFAGFPWLGLVQAVLFVFLLCWSELPISGILF